VAAKFGQLSGQSAKGSVSVRKPEEFGKRENCEKDISPGKVVGVPYLFNDRG